LQHYVGGVLRVEVRVEPALLVQANLYLDGHPDVVECALKELALEVSELARVLTHEVEALVE